MNAPDSPLVTYEDVAVEASEWFARMDAGSDAATRAEFEHWYARSDAHRAAYDELVVAWERLGALRDVTGSSFPVTAGLLPPAAVSPVQRAEPAARAARAARRTTGAARRLALAACLAVVVVTGAIVWDLRRPSAYETAVGELRTVMLDDGTAVALNTNTQLRVRLTGERRDIYLDRGEASFAVAHDASRPFSVYVDGTCVRATGTKFVVRRGPDVEVVVTEGAVAILRGADAVSLSRPKPDAPIVRAGGAANVAAGRVALERLSELDVDRRTAWQRGMLVFRNNTLAEIADEFNRYNDRKLVIADARVGELRMGGYFRTTNVEEFADVIEQSYAVRVRRSGDTIVLAQPVEEK